jgi:hypothetical protein
MSARLEDQSSSLNPYFIKESVMRNSVKLSGFIVATAFALTATAQQSANPMLDGKAVGEATTITAKVEAIDLPNRVVVVRGPMGRSVALKVDERVKNLPQVKVGDDLVFKYIESVSLELKKGSAGRMETSTSTGPITAPMGAKPGVAAATQTTMIANVEKVDTVHNVVLLQGPQGRYAEVKVRDPAVMRDVKVGDSVQATYTEAVLVEVVGPSKK